MADAVGQPGTEGHVADPRGSDLTVGAFRFSTRRLHDARATFVDSRGLQPLEIIDTATGELGFEGRGFHYETSL